MKRVLFALAVLLYSCFAIAGININTATKEQLEALPEIGPVKAQAIIDYRNANGPFKSPEDIMKVKGIKEGTFGKVKDQIGVSGESTPVRPRRRLRRQRPRPQQRRQQSLQPRHRWPRLLLPLHRRQWSRRFQRLHLQRPPRAPMPSQ